MNRPVPYPAPPGELTGSTLRAAAGCVQSRIARYDHLRNEYLGGLFPNTIAGREAQNRMRTEVERSSREVIEAAQRLLTLIKPGGS